MDGAFNARDAAGACDLFAPDLAYAVPDIPHGSYATMCGNLTRVLGTPDLTIFLLPPLFLREGFPRTVCRDSNCMLEREASVHGSIPFR